jgi:hypothetical protein
VGRLSGLAEYPQCALLVPSSWRSTKQTQQFDLFPSAKELEREPGTKTNPRIGTCGPSFARLSNASRYILRITKERRRPWHKRQPSTWLNDGTNHFLSSCSLTTCNNIISMRHGASFNDKLQFLVEKYGFSCRLHLPMTTLVISRVSRRFGYSEISQGFYPFIILAYLKYNMSLRKDSRSSLSRDASFLILLPEDDLARQLVRFSLLDTFKNPSCIHLKNNLTYPFGFRRF